MNNLGERSADRAVAPPTARHHGLHTAARRPSTRPVDAIGKRAPLGLPCHVNDANLWFAESPEDLERAKALCGTCPVRRECLSGALHRREPCGVWGGEILRSGRILPYKRPRGRPRKYPLVADARGPARKSA
ncbi:MAG TPA: WhiB family transcriptional regulator [Jatrophihabitans sp.]|nr:WhiB family transcriptional regulator [Jatrophihabitans sp.]